MKVLKQLRKVDRQYNGDIRSAVNVLAGMPHCQGVKAMTKHRYGYRLRIGRDRQEKLVPNEVVNLTFDHNWLPMRAWREHLGLTQAEVAAKANMTQGAYAQMDSSAKPRHASLKKIAKAMGLIVGQLDF